MVPLLANPVTSSLPEIYYTNEMEREFPSVFMYAIAGAGKTNALRSLKDAGFNPLVLATEDGQTKGMSTLADMRYAALLVNNIAQLDGIAGELLGKAKKGELFYKTSGPFNLLALDSMTGVGPWLEDESKRMKGWPSIWGDVATGGKKDPRTAYPYIGEKGRQIVRKLMDLPVPLVVTCREQTLTEDLGGGSSKSYAGPELPGQKLPKELPGWFEATVRLRMVNGERVFITENEGDVVARVRLGEGHRLDHMVKPDLGALLKVLQGDYSYLEKLRRTPTVVPKTPQQLAAEQRK